MEHLFTSESIISFFILVVLEVVLGIDNVIFVSIILNRLSDIKQQKTARRIWMITGIISRSLLLLGLSWLLSQKGKSLFTLAGKGFDLASLVMLAGGLFLIYKSVMEIHHKLEGEDPNAVRANATGLTLGKAVAQIMLIDAVFSFDSIITAGGTAQRIHDRIRRRADGRTARRCGLPARQAERPARPRVHGVQQRPVPIRRESVRPRPVLHLLSERH